MFSESSIEIRRNSPVTDERLNELFFAALPGHRELSFRPVFADEQLVGYVNVAWDGGTHAFLLDPTVHPEYRRLGVGRQLVQQALEVARERGVAWVPVDYVPELREFYLRCGFRETGAGVISFAN